MAELLDNLKQLVELDRSFGIEFQGKPVAGQLPPLPAASSQRPATSDQRPAVDPVLPVAPAERRTPNAERRTAPALPALSGLASADLDAIAVGISQCRACGLCEQRTRTVPGEGPPTPDVVFVGEGPGADEDASGRPFVGAAGQLLDKMICAMGLKREEVFICNVVKCRPPGNRAPEPDEMAACLPFLEAQLATLKPKVICLLGATPLKALLGLTGITRLHGQRKVWRGVPVIPSFHPAYLLRNAEAKKPAWEDLKVVLGVLGREPPKR